MVAISPDEVRAIARRLHRVRSARAALAVASITCPRCGLTSRHPDDVREGYCGHCHDWTGARRG